MVYVSTLSTTDQTREEIRKQPGCQTLTKALLHLAWKVLQKEAAEKTLYKGNRVTFPLSWKIFLNPFHLETHTSFAHRTELPQSYMLVVRNLLTPQLQKPAVLRREGAHFLGWLEDKALTRTFL